MPDHRLAATPRRRRRQLGLIVLLAAALTLLLAPPALANFFTPKSGGSPNANAIDSLYKIILYLAAVVFVIVEGALVYSVYKFRAKKGAVAAQIHGNTRLEIGWTIAAALILVVITVVTFVKLPSIINPPNSSSAFFSASLSAPIPPDNKYISVCVEGRQYIWRYVYGTGCKQSTFTKQLPYSFTEMVVPVGQTVVLSIQADDVIHSWWIPSLGGKVDAVPGYTTYAWFKVTHPGLYHGQCAQLCGRGHAAMLAQVRAVPPAEYQAWLTRQGQLIKQQNALVNQLRTYLRSINNL